MSLLPDSDGFIGYFFVLLPPRFRRGNSGSIYEDGGVGVRSRSGGRLLSLSDSEVVGRAWAVIEEGIIGSMVEGNLIEYGVIVEGL